VQDDWIPLGRSIGRTHKFVRAWGDKQLEPLDATVTDWILLHHVDAADAPGLSQSEAARFSDMGGPAMVRHIDRLEEAGILVRTRDEHDRRVTRVTLTDLGRERLVEIAAVMLDCDRQLRQQLSEEEATVLQDACERLFRFAYTQTQTQTPSPSQEVTP
jgi:MarR family transcriptional regulator, transcriptional regulator for hemolysin